MKGQKILRWMKLNCQTGSLKRRARIYQEKPDKTCSSQRGDAQCQSEGRVWKEGGGGRGCQNRNPAGEESIAGRSQGQHKTTFTYYTRHLNGRLKNATEKASVHGDICHLSRKRARPQKKTKWWVGGRSTREEKEEDKKDKRTKGFLELRKLLRKGAK